jgi:hypothetical protein
MTRYTPVCEDDTLYLVGEDNGDRVEIGAVEDVVHAVGGETHTIEYDEKQRTQPWLETVEGTLDIDVREAVTLLPHTAKTVEELRGYGMDTDRDGLPARTVAFANVVVDILNRRS